MREITECSDDLRSHLDKENYPIDKLIDLTGMYNKREGMAKDAIIAGIIIGRGESGH